MRILENLIEILIAGTNFSPAGRKFVTVLGRFMLITDATVILINTVDNIGTPSKQTTQHDADPVSVD